MTDAIQIDSFLAHYGVLGMKWGVRKDDGSWTVKGDSSIKNKRAEKRLVKARGLRKASFKERREIKDNLNLQRNNLILKASKKYPEEILVKSLFLGDSGPIVRTGKEFVAAVESGRTFHSNYTDMFASTERVQKEFGEKLVDTYMTPKYIEDKKGR